MIHHRLNRWLLALTVLVCLTARAASAQLSHEIVQAPNANQYRADIDKFVATQVAGLGGAGTAQKNARDLLVNETLRAGATSSFLDEYADSINGKIIPLAQSKETRTRLNAAIVVQRVAMKAGNARLAPATLAFVQDKSDAVVLWGIKASEYIIPAMLSSSQPATKLSEAVVSAAKEHDSGAIAEEAYHALLLDPRPPLGPNLSNVPAAALTSYIPQPMALFEYRVKLYDDLVPPQPLADVLGAGFFVKSTVWNAQQPAQQTHNLQTMIALLRGAAKQSAADPKPELTDVIRQTAQALEVAGGLMKNNALKQAAHGVAGIGIDTAPNIIDTRIGAVEAAVQSPTSATAGNRSLAAPGTTAIGAP